MSFARGHALVIGVADYLDPNLRIPLTITGVPITVADAQAVAAALKDPTICAYRPDQVRDLTGPQATRSGVMVALQELAQRTKAGDTVVVFFSGHGAACEEEPYSLATQDAVYMASDKKIKTGTGLSASELIALMRGISNAQKLLLILNACFSGYVGALAPGAPSATLGAPPPDALADGLAKGEGRVVITASRATQFSHFLDGDDHTFFGRALIDALRGTGMTSKGGYIGVFELYEQIYASVHAAAAKIRRIQEPVITIKENVGPFPVAHFRGAVAGDLSAVQFLEAPSAGTAVRLVARDVVQALGPGARAFKIDTGGGDVIINLPSSTEQGESGNVFGYLHDRIGPIRDFTGQKAPERDIQLEGPVPVNKLMEMLKGGKMRHFDDPPVARVQGTFAPVLLLYPGWWEREPEVKRPEIAWRDELQEWLFYGFQEWGPSWDLAPRGKERRPTILPNWRLGMKSLRSPSCSAGTR